MVIESPQSGLNLKSRQPRTRYGNPGSTAQAIHNAELGRPSSIVRARLHLDRAEPDLGSLPCVAILLL
jgi:hypothetical protein